MTSNEAYVKIYGEEPHDLQSMLDYHEKRFVFGRGWEAAQQQSSGEIAELKEKYEATLCKTNCPACGSDTANTNEAKINKLNRELKADNEQLREALKRLREDRKLWKISSIGGQDSYAGLPPAIRIIDEALSATSAQSLQAHDNEVIERYNFLKDRTYLNNRGWVIEAVKYKKYPTTFENDLDIAIQTLKDNHE